MSWMNLFLFLLLLFGAVCVFVSLKKKGEWKEAIDKKEHKLYFLYPTADFILTKTGLYRYLQQKAWIEEAGKALKVADRIPVWQKLYWCSKLSLVMTILYLSLMMAFCSRIQASHNSYLIDGNRLVRPDYGEGDQEVRLKVSMEPIEEPAAEGEKMNSFTEEMTLRIKERSYQKEQLEKLFQDAAKYLDIAVLGENESAEAVYEDLCFCRNIPETSLLVDWKPEDLGLIGRDGSVKNEEIKGEGVRTKVTAILSYQEEVREHTMEFSIMPRQYAEEEKLHRKLEEAVQTASESTREEPWLKLPYAVDGYRLSWAETGWDISKALFGLGLLTAVLAWIYKDKELEKQMKHRKNQMLLDYPEIINKFNLLINAGMTVKQAWIKIAEDYKKKKEEGGIEKRYAYEEMLLTVHKLRLSVPEPIAYEAFGRRTGLVPYMKFSTLIAQNLKKGSSGLCELLSREAAEAFESRKETAKRLGEEAGVKLLGPMMVMLIIVFMIILIPAFLSFTF